MLCPIWYHLYNLKKREKHSWRKVNFNKVSDCNMFSGGKEKVHWFDIDQDIDKDF